MSQRKPHKVMWLYIHRSMESRNNGSKENYSYKYHHIKKTDGGMATLLLSQSDSMEFWGLETRNNDLM